MNRPILALFLALPLCCCAQAVVLAGKTVVSFASFGGMGDSSVKFQALLAVAVLVAGGCSHLRPRRL